MRPLTNFKFQSAEIWLGDASGFYAQWPAATVIISDGPYGLSSFPGDPPTPDDLGEWYREHAAAWAKYSKPNCTLWFWNSELGWANAHRTIVEAGWDFKNCHIWDKGIGHIAGNANTKTLRKFPVTTEVCVQYVRRNLLPTLQGEKLRLKDWLRHEWTRSGLTLNRTNEACGVKNAATRKYFTKCHLWYFPPAEAFEALQQYANKFGRKDGRPYFSADGQRPLTGHEWNELRAKFKCSAGITNVWTAPSVRGQERLKRKFKCVHMNQKPLKLLERCIAASSDPGDVVWEPFGGLCSATIAANQLGRPAYAAEINPEFFELATDRLFNDASFPSITESAA